MEGRRNSSYLGRPSSGVQDLKGKQEHSQQRTRDCGKLCDTNKQASCAELRCLCYWKEQRDGGRGGAGGHTDRVPHDEHPANRSRLAMRHQSLTSHRFGYLNSPPPCDWQDRPPPNHTPNTNPQPPPCWDL